MSLLSRIGNTPMVPLARIGKDLPVPLLGKCEFLNPGGSGKDRIALAIVDHAERTGDLRSGMTLIEATAGNTGIGLAIVAAHRGYRLVCVMPEKMSVDKQRALATLGAEVIVVPNAPPDDHRNFRRVAEQLAIKNGWYLTRQFEHPANPAIHATTTGPEILAQCGGQPGALVCGAGTGGTLSGAGAFLKRHCPRMLVVLADPVGSRFAHFVDPAHPDEDLPYQVEGIGGSEIPAVFDPGIVDIAERVTDDESFEMTGRLLREEGLLAGGSSGTAVVAALRVAARSDIAGPVVVILADSWDRYFSRPWMKDLAGFHIVNQNDEVLRGRTRS